MDTKQQEKVEDLYERAMSIIDQADAEERGLTEDEQIEVDGLHANMKRLRSNAKLQSEITALGEAIGSPSSYVATDPHATAGDGWAHVAEQIASKRASHLEIPTESLLTKQGTARGKTFTGTELSAGEPLQLPGVMSLGADRRFLYPLLSRTPVAGQLSVRDYPQTGSRDVTGSVLRNLTATTDKAELDLALEHVGEDLKQVSVVISDVPNALLRGVTALTAFLRVEGQFQLDKAIDDHVLDSISAAPHTFNAEGTTVVERLRRAVGAHRAEGYDPSIAVVSPDTAADLDLLSFDNGYQFDTRQTGGASPLWNLNLVEIPTAVDPILIDPVAIGSLALGPTKVDVDESAGFKQNTSDVRLEASVLMVVRNGNGAYEVALKS